MHRGHCQNHLWIPWTLRFVIAVGIAGRCCHGVDGLSGRVNCTGLGLPGSLAGEPWLGGLTLLGLSLPTCSWQLSEPLGPLQRPYTPVCMGAKLPCIAAQGVSGEPGTQERETRPCLACIEGRPRRLLAALGSKSRFKCLPGLCRDLPLPQDLRPALSQSRVLCGLYLWEWGRGHWAVFWG